MSQQGTAQFDKSDKRASSLVDLVSRQRYALGDERLTIGRSEDSKVRLKDDVYVSSHHAEIYFQGDTFWLSDLGSTNGTLKNAAPVTEKPVTIQRGDIITIGRTRFEVE